MNTWRAELGELVARGRSVDGDADVREALEEALATLTAEPLLVQPLSPVVAVLGVSSCVAGWVGILVRPSGQTTLHLSGSLGGLVEQVRDQETLGAVGISAGTRRDEADAWLLTRPSVEILEFLELDANPDVLAEAGLTLPAMYSGMGFAEVDLRMAGAAVIEAARLFS